MATRFLHNAFPDGRFNHPSYRSLRKRLASARRKPPIRIATPDRDSLPVASLLVFAGLALAFVIALVAVLTKAAV